MPDEIKKCVKCKEDRPLSFFGPSSRSHDGLSGTCNVCKGVIQEPDASESPGAVDVQEEPKQEEPKQDEPNQDEPNQEEPKQDEPKQEEPKGDATTSNVTPEEEQRLIQEMLGEGACKPAEPVKVKRRMLRQKTSGRVYIWTSNLASRDDMEIVNE